MSLTNEQAESILAPLMKKYLDALNTSNWKQVENFYHVNSVMIEKGKSCMFGNQAIVDSFKGMGADFGKYEVQISNSRYEGVGDFVNIHTDFSFVTEKQGTLSGKFTQIWKKEDGKYAILHDQFEL
ncbi:DUF4440 domain-containing protein [Caenorhabditis elegans]|uniref:DUF4440 domain-containing protein n=1 Tax=Caenorhabditis elegans TaxID=6239 RepID=G5ECA7_CAEEL|nr:DUF4440 domain-containing protein [Caenorhabditis elegans]CAE54899.2 DUF4440 domain-containing protein [Caenorhabditis elegans]|eukprot:NP_001023352.2 Uncharacterized protein CELE_T02D1.8 [Caenorhabditis elegans]